MAIDLYNISGRVAYGEVVAATAALVEALLARATAGGRFQHNFTGTVDVSTNRQTQTAAISINRGASNKIAGVTILVPAIDPDTLVSAAMAKQMVALILHECGHALFTGPALNCSPDTDPNYMLRQAIEDYYNERRLTNPDNPIASEASALLGALNDTLMSGVSVGAEHARAMGDPESAASAYLLSHLNRHGQQGGALRAELKAVEAVTDPRVAALCDQLMNDLDACADSDGPGVAVSDFGTIGPQSAKRRALQDRFIAALGLVGSSPQGEDEGEDQKQKPGKGQPGKGQPGKGKPGKGEDAEGKGEGEGEGEDDAEGEGEGEGEDEGSGKGKGKGERDDGEDDAEGGGGVSRTGRANRMGKGVDVQARRETVLEVPEQTDAQRTFAATILPRVVGGVDAPPAGFFPLGENTKPARDAAALAARLCDPRRFADAARRALKSPETVTVTRRLQSGRLDRRSLTRASMGALDVMSRRRTDVGVTTAVMIMLDMSGSMSSPFSLPGNAGNVSRFAGSVGVMCALSAAIERAGAECAIGGFQEGPYQLVPFNVRKVSTEHMLEEYGVPGFGGGTSMIAATLYAEQALAARRVSRRVCIWLCDGQPGSGEVPILRELYRRAFKSKGIEHYGIGLGINLATLFGPAQIAVHNVAGLPVAFERLLLANVAGK